MEQHSTNGILQSSINTPLLSSPSSSSKHQTCDSEITTFPPIASHESLDSLTPQDLQSHQQRETYINVKPSTLLVMFTSLSFFLYFDRGVFSASLDNVKSAFHMKNLKGGICSSAYLVCYCVSGPIFAQIAKYRTPLRLCSIGMVVWVAAVVFSGLSIDFFTLMLARALTGIGEASFLVMAAPFIDFFAPPAKRSTWLAIFYSAIPIGYAAGAAIGAQIISSNVFGEHNTWRSVYFLEGICVLPCVLLFTTIKGPNSLLEISPKRNLIDENQNKTALRLFIEDLKCLLNNRLYVLIVLGYAMQTFFVGAVAIYAIEYLQTVYNLSKGESGVIFGGMTALTGLGGSALGGALLDYLKPKPQDQNATSATTQSHEQKQHQSTKLELECEIAAHKLMVACACIGAPAAMAAFMLKRLSGFLPLLLIGELAAFVSTGPINSAVLWCVPIDLQPTAMAISTLAIHILGDALSPIVIGAVSDKWDLKLAMLVSACALYLSAVFFICGLARSVHELRKKSRLFVKTNLQQ